MATTSTTNTETRYHDAGIYIEAAAPKGWGKFVPMPAANEGPRRFKISDPDAN